MPGSTPSCYCGHFAYQFGRWWGQTHWDNVLLIYDISVQTNQGQVILKIGWIVIRMYFFAFYAKLLMIKTFFLTTDIPFSQADLHVGIRSAVEIREGSVNSSQAIHSIPTYVATQWAAVTTQRFETRAPPQLSLRDRNPLLIKATCQGWEPKPVECPPTIRLERE